MAVVHKVAIPGTFALAIAADGDISALTIVPSTILSELTDDCPNEPNFNLLIAII